MFDIVTFAVVMRYNRIKSPGFSTFYTEGDPKKKQDVTKAYPAYTDSGYRIPGAKAIRVDPITGDQIPIMLQPAEVYSDQDELLSGLEDAVSGSILGELAKQYKLSDSKINEARNVADIGFEFSGIPGSMRTVNRVFGENTVTGNPLFTPPADASTFDKVLDAADIIGAMIPVLGAGAKYGLKAAKPALQAGASAAKDAVLSPAALKAVDKLLKPDPSRGFSGGLLSRQNLPDGPSVNHVKRMRLSRQKEVDSIIASYGEKYGHVKGSPMTPEEITRIKDSLPPEEAAKMQDEITAVEKKYKKEGAIIGDVMDKMEYGIDLDNEELDIAYKYLSDELKDNISSVSSLRDALKNQHLNPLVSSAANRGVQAIANKPVVGDALKLLARNMMNASGGSSGMSETNVLNIINGENNIFGKNRPISYDGTVWKATKDASMADKGPNVVDAYIYGDFSNFTPNKSAEADRFVRSTFKNQFDTYGDMNVVELPMMSNTSPEKPLKFKLNNYGGIEQVYDPDVNGVEGAQKAISHMFSDSESALKRAKETGHDRSRALSNVINQAKKHNSDKLLNVKDDPSAVYNLNINDDGIPTSFNVNAPESYNLFNPVIDIAGHQMKFDLISDDGTNALYKVTSADVWKFTPDQYLKKWGVSESDGQKMKQAAMLNATGKPFVSVSEDYVEIPTKLLKDKNLTPGTY